MPLPTPNDGESEDEFMERCMEHPTMVEEFDQDQRYKVCESRWDNNSLEEMLEALDDVNELTESLEEALEGLMEGADS